MNSGMWRHVGISPEIDQHRDRNRTARYLDHGQKRRLCGCGGKVLHATSRSLKDESRATDAAGISFGTLWWKGGGQRLKTGHFAHPIKEDVKKKHSSPPLGEMRVW